MDLEARRIDVNATLIRSSGYVGRGPTKTDRVRQIAIGPVLVQTLRVHHGLQAERHLGLGHRIDAETLLFTGPFGDPVNGHHITEHVFKPRLASLGLPLVRLHDLRHAFASMMLSAGVRIDVVSQMLGHRSSAMTLDIYAHLLPGDQEAAAELLENLLRR